ncbi:hypothetical protein KSF_089520 [Reticulibacter mediterranei]|uniref:Uncharacterized protein n=1 Tax=Reticulibacter mediterranei TaxID=2778369 RepID=A0A8J3N5B2_9CHLR|nr:hypothetical protein KSF_089520 [Reticulibacter mediterranei]
MGAGHIAFSPRTLPVFMQSAWISTLVSDRVSLSFDWLDGVIVMYTRAIFVLRNNFFPNTSPHMENRMDSIQVLQQ